MSLKVLWMRGLVVYGLLTVLGAPVLQAATRQGRASLRQLNHDIRRSRGSSVVSSVRLHPKDDTIAIVTANSGWNRLTTPQKQELGRKWLSRWITLRKRFGSDVVLDIKTPDGYPLSHCYGNTREGGQCR